MSLLRSWLGRRGKDENVQYGGFPEVVLADKIHDKEDLIKDILSSYINLDLLALSDIKKSTEAFKLIKLLASRIGSKLDVSKICNLIRLNRVRVENYLRNCLGFGVYEGKRDFEGSDKPRFAKNSGLF